MGTQSRTLGEAFRGERGGCKAGMADSSRDRKKGTVSLSELLSHECMIERIERIERRTVPLVVCGKGAQEKKGEDFTLVKTNCYRVEGDESTAFNVFGVEISIPFHQVFTVFCTVQIFDGHNGKAAALFAMENLLKNVIDSIPQNLSREEWLKFLPQALVVGFIKTDQDFEVEARTSGTTVTLVIVDKWTITAASVGDSRCIIDTTHEMLIMTVDHRLEDNKEECERITKCGGEVSRLMTPLGGEYGPLRCWPGGLCLSRSIGDFDVGKYIVPIPFVKQIKLPNFGGRIIIASDGVWDALSSEDAVKCCRELSPEFAAKQIVQEAIKAGGGIRDDTTCLVVDIILPYTNLQVQEINLLISNGMYNAVEIFEEGSANLNDRIEFKTGK